MPSLSRLGKTTALTRFRLAAHAFACYTALAGVFGATDQFGALVGWMGRLGGVLLVALYVVTFVRRRAFVLEPVVLAILIVVTGAGQADPEQTISLSLGALAVVPVNAGIRFIAVRLGLVLTAFVFSPTVTPAARAVGMTWQSEDVLTALPPLAMLGALIATVYVLLVRQESATARESLLARSGQQMINLIEVAKVRAVVTGTLTALCEDWPGRTVLITRFGSAEPSGGSTEVTVEFAVRNDLVGQTVPLLTGTGTESSAVDAPARARLALLTGDDQAWWGFRFSDGDLGVLISGRAVPDVLGDALRTLGTQWSLAERNCRHHAELAWGANSDHLTELPNRRSFLRELATTRDNAVGHTVLLLIDLDDFKQINDGYGHAAGDGLLVEIAARITRAAGTSGLAARLGGDEFALLLTGLEDAGAADGAAEALRAQLVRPVELAEATVSVGASIGLAIAEPHLTAGDLMRCADVAMYSAKARGKNRVERFREHHHGSVANVRRIEEHLAYAVERGEMTVWYQPRVDLTTGRVLGFEGRARWDDRVMGPIPLAVFLPLAIRTGRINGIGRHVLASACAQLAAWRASRGADDLTMSLSVVPAQLYDPSFVAVVRETLTNTGVPADRLIIDIAQDQAIDLDRASEPITELAALGVRVALDDFGTAHSTLAGLCAFPVHQIKVDRVLATDSSESNHAMLQVLALAADVLGCELVADGVETHDQAEAMREAGVAAAQGSLYAAAMPAFEAWLWLTRPGRLTPAREVEEQSGNRHEVRTVG
jgi:diguanylate cyclase (GGDEF)-like protein